MREATPMTYMKVMVGRPYGADRKLGLICEGVRIGPRWASLGEGGMVQRVGVKFVKQF